MLINARRATCTHSYGKPDGWTLAGYEAAGGYRGVAEGARR